MTYGHHSVSQFLKPGGVPINHADRDYLEALDRPGAGQMKHLRALIESRDFFSRVPDQSLVASEIGEKGETIQAASGDGYGMVYLPTTHPVEIRIDKISEGKVKAAWFDPRDGTFTLAGVYEGVMDEVQSLMPIREGPDWVLVI